MIDEEATFKKFGYYPHDLKPHSNKKIIAVCDGCGKIRELGKDNYSALCMSCSRKGENSPFWGKHLPKATRGKMSKAREGEKNHNWQGGPKKRVCIVCGKEFYVYRYRVEKGYGNYCSHSCATKVNRRHQKFPTHHTKPERIFESICKKNKLPFKYTGDGSFWIHNINPDFVECNGKKIAVEVFGDYWHSPLLNYKLRENNTYFYRKKILKKYGWKLIVFWETDLLREDAEAFVSKTLEKKL